MARTLDCMGYRLKPVFDLFTKEEVKAAKRLAKPRYQWDVVGTDPRVMGWRFLRDAKICLSGKDLGADCPVDNDGNPRGPGARISALGKGAA